MLLCPDLHNRNFFALKEKAIADRYPTLLANTVGKL